MLLQNMSSHSTDSSPNVEQRRVVLSQTDYANAGMVRYCLLFSASTEL